MDDVFKFKVIKQEFENGLRVLLIPYKAQSVFFSIWYRVGSRYEREGIRGISHLLEHMIFKGTKKLGAEEYSEIVQKMGGVDNAFTTEDQTVYYASIPHEAVYKIIEMEADRMENAVFREFEEEKKVVIEERKERVENSPFGKFWENLSLLSYSVHPYRYPIIGFEEDIKNITLKKLREFYNKFYSPSNSILVIAGRIESLKVLKKIKNTFGKINRKRNIPFFIPKEPEPKGEKRMVIKENSNIRLMGISFIVPQFMHKDFLKIYLLSNILGTGESSIFFKRFVYKENLCFDTQVVVEEKLDPSLFVFYAQLNKDAEFEKVEHIFWEEIDNIKKGEFSDEVLEKVKNMERANYIYRLQAPQGRGFLIGFFEFNGDYRKVYEYLGELEKIKKDDIVYVANKYLKRERSNVLILC